MHDETQQTIPPAAVAQAAPVRRGRKGDGNRDRVIKVRLTFDELVRIDIASGYQRMERSTWARRALLLQADREASYAPPPPVTLCPRDKAVMDQFAVTVPPALLPASTPTTEETESEGGPT
jgi:hypothetical protein